MSINLSWGAGGCSISPNLSCDRVVSSYSPIFQLMKENELMFYNSSETRLTERIDELMREIGRLYQDGKASVHDVDALGNNMLHVSHPCSLLSLLFN